MIAFIDDHRDTYGVEPICRVLPIAPSTYHERVAQRQDPTRLSARARQDALLKAEINSGKRTGVSTEVADKVKTLELEVRELRQANEILRKASAYFVQAQFVRPFRR